MQSRIALPLACAALAASGCAAPGNYPSLAPRPAEAVYAAGDPERVPVPAPDDPDLAGRVAAFVAAGRAGEASFEQAVARARPLAERAGMAGSDSWVEAQQAVSRAEAARAPTIRALADLDVFAVARAAQSRLSPADMESLAAGTAALQALADRQQAQLDLLQAMLKTR